MLASNNKTIYVLKDRLKKTIEEMKGLTKYQRTSTNLMLCIVEHDDKMKNDHDIHVLTGLYSDEFHYLLKLFCEEAQRCKYLPLDRMRNRLKI